MAFVERHPDQTERVIAAALEAAAMQSGIPANAVNDVRAAYNVVLQRGMPPALRDHLVSVAADEEMLTVTEAAERLEVTRATIYSWIAAKRLLAWRQTRRGMVIPAEQIIGSGTVLTGIERVLEVIALPAAAWNFLSEKSPYLDGRMLQRPIDALKLGKVDAVVGAARSHGEAFT